MTSIFISPECPTCEAAISLLEELRRFRGSITGEHNVVSLDVSDVQSQESLFILARDTSHQAVGCGAFRPLNENVAELRYMYARPNTKGVGAAILQHLELAALQAGHKFLWLGTRVANVRAVSFYENHKFSCIPNYGKYVSDTSAICLGKQLVR